MASTSVVRSLARSFVAAQRFTTKEKIGRSYVRTDDVEADCDSAPGRVVGPARVDAGVLLPDLGDVQRPHAVAVAAGLQKKQNIKLFIYTYTNIALLTQLD